MRLTSERQLFDALVTKLHVKYRRKNGFDKFISDAFYEKMNPLIEFESADLNDMDWDK